MQLRYDPYQIFRSSKSPAGLYARQKWLSEAGTASWQQDFQQTVAELYAGQSADGSWRGSARETVRRLFGLHLTVREPDTRIHAALDWLMQQIRLPYVDEENDAEALTDESLMGLPFVAGRRDIFTAAATLFLSTIFGRSEDPTIVGIYQRLTKAIRQDQDVEPDIASLCNVLRALVVNPKYSNDRFTAQALEALAKRQRQTGEWEPPIPFYQTLNALAHLDSVLADAQLDKAFNKLAASQKRGGSWSNGQPEWNTFLAVHALRNKARI
ncbi:MAG: hypothetical protein JSW26_26660 [Desulfobacterales bacterium]|nr:MAG: hypothetical protein JSW26_26660 [Desulfobacterales bacterium]